MGRPSKIVVRSFDELAVLRLSRVFLHRHGLVADRLDFINPARFRERGAGSVVSHKLDHRRISLSLISATVNRPRQPLGVAQCCTSPTPAFYHMPGEISSKF